MSDMSGERGDTGLQGAAGERGPKGDHGQHGDTGATGRKGIDAKPNRLAIVGYFILTVSSVFALFYTNASANYNTCLSVNTSHKAARALIDNISAYGIVTPERAAELNKIRLTVIPINCNPPPF